MKTYAITYLDGTSEQVKAEGFTNRGDFFYFWTIDPASLPPTYEDILAVNASIVRSIGIVED